jgi:type I restriction enzyme R subunit
MDKKQLSEREICSKFITPAIQKSGSDLQTQIREEVSFTAGTHYSTWPPAYTRGEQRRADYVLYQQKNQPLAVIEVKDNKHKLGDGM